MGPSLVGLAMLVFWLWAIYDVITTPDTGVRYLPKVAWVFIVILLWVIGAFAWVALGREPGARSAAGAGSAARAARGGGGRGGDPRWHPALDQRVGRLETERERIERERREFYRQMDDELDRRIAERGGLPPEDDPPPAS